MERMTDKAWKNIDPWEMCGQDHFCGRGCHDIGGCTGGCIVPKLYKRLAEYEDAEEQGRLFVAPFKIGDKAYIAQRGRIYELIIENITQPVCYTVSEDGYRDVDIYMNDVGRYVFKTREEAEAALKGATP